MKKIFVLFLISALSFGCKTESKENEVSDDSNNVNTNSDKSEDGLITIAGEFVYFADAAVLQTNTGIYGVVINEKMHELNNKVSEFKNDPTDFVPVTIRCKISPKPEGEEGWDYNIEIKEIIKVDRPDPNKDDVIKLGNN